MPRLAIPFHGEVPRGRRIGSPQHLTQVSENFLRRLGALTDKRPNWHLISGQWKLLDPVDRSSSVAS